MPTPHASTAVDGRPASSTGASGSGRRLPSPPDQPRPPALLTSSSGSSSSILPAPGPAGESKVKRISQPPGKKACLACRARKTKCNGLEPACNHCLGTGGMCEYVASRRGGSKPKRDRVPKAQAGPSSSSLRAQSTSVGPDAGQRQPSTSAVAKAQAVDFQATLEPADDPMEGVEDFVAKLQGFMRNLRPGSQPTAVVAADPHDLMADSVSLMSGWKNEDWRVRRFPDGESILAGYWAEIYPFEPLLPPPSIVAPQTLLATLSPPSPATPSIPTSPLLLALLGALVLVPHPADPEPRSAASKLARQQASQRYVKEAERQLELMMARAGSSQPPLEAVQVLSVAGLYHWAQEASVAKMRARQAQALQLAMDLGLHLSDASLTFAPEDEWQRDMRRRTFWLAMARVLIGSVISGLPPSVPPFDPRITAELPACSADPQVWSDQIDALRYSVYVRSFIDQLASSPGYIPSNPHQLFDLTPASGAMAKDDRIREYERLDLVLTNLIREGEVKVGLASSAMQSSVAGQLDPEAMLCATFRRSALMCQTMTLVDLHRRSALHSHGGIGVFTERLCGLPSISDTPSGVRINEMFASVTAISTPPTTVSPSLSTASHSAWPSLASCSMPTALTSLLPCPIQRGFDDLLGDALSTWSPPAENAASASVFKTAAATQHSAPASTSWPDLPEETMALGGPFAAQHSLAKVRAGVEAIARLEVLNQAMTVSVQESAMPTLPFCACELVAAAYCLLLLALTLQSTNPTAMDKLAVHRELQDIWASCWILLRGLRGYGAVWSGLDRFADELQAALNASLALSGEPARVWD